MDNINRKIFTAEEINLAKNYLKFNKLPDDYIGSRLYRFKKKYSDFSLDNNDNLIYNNKIVVAVEDKEKVLKECYNDPILSRNSRDAFYDRVSDKYIGISKKDCFDFLKKQESYQLHLRPKSIKIVKPIYSSAPNKIWQADLVDLSDISRQNKGYNFILTVIDVFSRFVWSKPLKNKESKTVAIAFEEIIKENKPCKLLNTDRGPEFLNSDFKEILDKYNIKHVPGSPYTPKNQASIERFNQTLKHLIYSYFTKEQTKNWIDILDALIENYNNTTHSSTNYKPKDLINQPIRSRIVLNLSRSLKAEADKKLRNSAMNTSFEELNVGDKVRILLDKDLFDKMYKELWSKEIYEVEKVIKSKVGGLSRYKIADKIYPRNKLQKVIEVQTSTIAKNPPKRKNKEYKLPEKTLLEERPKRTVRKPEKLNL